MTLKAYEPMPHGKTAMFYLGAEADAACLETYELAEINDVLFVPGFDLADPQCDE